MYTSWCDKSPLITKVASCKMITGQCPCLFFSKFQIPWIWRWSINISKDKNNIPVLQRNFFYKWWTKMSPEDIKTIALNITNTIKIDETKNEKEQSSQNFSIDEVKNYYQRKYPQETEDQIMIRVLDYMKKQTLKI